MTRVAVANTTDAQVGARNADDVTLTELNRKVDVERQDPMRVAADWLTQNELVP
ncbi:MAG: hypothetical protein M3O34_09920 [Chloroflexota bacterium]|nr:hypothetical protein [Chloroflexota bacterium]